MPKVSAIIPTYNREELVVQAVESALNQSFKDLEVIVVDDGSSDNTRRALERYRNRIRYIYQKNAGVSAARNKGIESSESEWLAFLDSDDEWRGSYLFEQMRRARATPGICMQAADCLYTGLNGEQSTYFRMNNVLPTFKRNDYLMMSDPFRFVIEHGPWQVGATVFHRDAVKKAGLFDEDLRISEDFDFMARMALQGPLGLVREALVNIYRRKEAIPCLSQPARSAPLQARESDERMYEKLLRIGSLTRGQRRALNKIMSANKRAIGNLLLAAGKKREARECYRRAVLVHPSLRSLGKYILSFPRTN